MSVSIELTNKREIIQLLDKLPRAFESKAVRKLIKYSVVPLVKRIKEKAPRSLKPHRGKYGMVTPGTLIASVGTIDMKRSKNVALVVGLRVKGAFGKAKSGFYGMWVERGTKNMPAQPFLRPSYDETKDEVVRRFEHDAKKIFEKEIAKWTKQGKI